ncbi:hypothetical protein Poly59_32790 [Rubripirellula reticaptiva]|uniref:Uncharacterized protein n=1 Tax=Rubripirellula reticaptiva TaxID=2528013 RepID=A0A5C6ETH3_9BACT|nr:hypothetical protein Poly59_32790 [Rubripirellula reticaptiva]
MAADEWEDLRTKVRCTLAPIKEVDANTQAEKDFLFKAEETVEGRQLPPYQIVHFLFCDLLGFRNLGRFEKIAWSVPIDFDGRAFLIEHRKFGLGLFARDKDTDKDDARQIVKKIRKASKVARPYFDFIASRAVAASEISVMNRSNELFERFTFFVELYRGERGEAESRKDETIKTVNGNSTLIQFPHKQLERNAKWLAISAIDAFYSWTEHLFVHIAIVLRGIDSGEAIAELTGVEWGDKFKTSIGIDQPVAKKYYDELVIVRRQLRNFLAHGAFGKNGQAFNFHSSAGAVPVLMPHDKSKSRFALDDNLAFEEDAVIELLEKFVDFLWKGETETAMHYVQESYLPSILTLAKDGTYAKATNSLEEMNEMIDHLSGQFDRAANMDW